MLSLDLNWINIRPVFRTLGDGLLLLPYLGRLPRSVTYDFMVARVESENIFPGDDPLNLTLT